MVLKDLSPLLTIYGEIRRSTRRKLLEQTCRRPFKNKYPGLFLENKKKKS